MLTSANSGIVQGPSVRWNALDAAVYVGLNSANGIRQLIDREPTVPAGFRHPRYEVGSTSSLTPMLRDGFGFGIVPALAAGPMVDQGLIVAPLEQPRMYRDLQLIKRKGHGLSPSAQALVEQVATALSLLALSAHIEMLIDRVMVREFAG